MSKSKLDLFVTEASTVAIAGHVRPDGDCAGSCLATYNYLKTYYPNKQIHLYLEPIPQVFEFLAGSEEIRHTCDSDQVYDLFIAQDCGDEARLGQAAKYFRSARKTVCVDHHISNQSFADVNYIFPDASSTSELIYELMDPQKITKAIAECLYVGMVHDTGVFQYSNTSAKTMEIAGRLMACGIAFSEIVDQTFYEKTYIQNRILGRALLNSCQYLNGAVTATVLTLSELSEFQADSRDLEGIVNQLRITKGTEAAVFLYENEDHTFKVSTRSGNLVDVSQIAVQFGGGGHKKAAGFTMTGTPEAILDEIIAKIREQLDQEGRTLS